MGNLQDGCYLLRTDLEYESGAWDDLGRYLCNLAFGDLVSTYSNHQDVRSDIVGPYHSYRCKIAIQQKSFAIFFVFSRGISIQV